MPFTDVPFDATFSTCSQLDQNFRTIGPNGAQNNNNLAHWISVVDGCFWLFYLCF